MTITTARSESTVSTGSPQRRRAIAIVVALVVLAGATALIVWLLTDSGATRNTAPPANGAQPGTSQLNTAPVAVGGHPAP